MKMMKKNWMSYWMKMKMRRKNWMSY